MINFKVSAPGRLNLFGEHSKCDDHNGVMTSIDMRTTVKFNELPHSEAVIKIEIPDIDLNWTILLRQFRKFYKSCTFDDTLSKQILHFISSEYLWDHECHKSIGHAFLYLLAYVTCKEKIDIEEVTPFQMYVNTLLSSINFGGIASFAVCFTTCFLHWSHLRKNAHYKLNDDDRVKISMYSKSCDDIFDYCMFKSDVTVCTYGCIMRYYCKDSSKNDILVNMPSMRVLLINSNVDSDMIELTRAKVNLRICYPHITNSILDSIRIISDTAFSVLKEIRDINKEVDTEAEDIFVQEKKLFPLMCMQQELNEIFTFFTEAIHTICSIAQRYKLSGKCADIIGDVHAYIWYPSETVTQATHIMLMTEELKSKGFNVEEVKLDYNGVKIE